MHASAVYCIFIVVTLLGPALVAAATAKGVVRGMGARSTFIGDFVVDGIKYRFLGNLVPPRDFMCPDATLEYDNVAQLTGPGRFNGKVGTQDITLRSLNGLTITGPLVVPVPPSALSAMGTWSRV